MKRITSLLTSIIFMFVTILSCFPIDTVKAESQSHYIYGRLNDNYVMTRTCPSFDCNSLRHDEGGIIYLSEPRVVEIKEINGDWAKISYNYWGFPYEGYMYKRYLDIVEVDLDKSYENKLRQKGFPESYIIKLSKMHAIHPNWDFEVSSVGETLHNVVSNEYNPLSKNLINTTNTSMLSTDSYSNGAFIQYEPGWYAPSFQTLTYFLDARNFLDDNSIFMFEQLSYNSNQTEEIVQRILNNSFMSGSYEYNGTNWTYAKTFVEAGKKYGVSPVHLAARVMQEQGRNGSGTTNMEANGQVYHNYFNFNAYGSSNSEIINNALNYAIRNGWNSPYAAIMGGAEDIADGYISNGQDTLFYQKFNLVGNYGRYYHQYMANIQAPYSESYTSYVSYKHSGLIDSSFTFKIPVYSDMPAATVISEKSSNNNLNSLSVSNYALSPKFDSSITSYSVVVDYTVTSVDIEVEKSDNKASVEGTGNKKLSVGDNKIDIVVTAEGGNKKTYTVTINRKQEEKVDMEEKPESVIKRLNVTNDNGNLSGFKLGENVSDIVNKMKEKYPKAIIKMYNSGNKEINSGILATGQRIVITANGTKSYNVIIKGDINGDGKISAIDYSKVKSHILKLSTLNSVYSLAADANKDGKISAIDYSKIKSHILNLSSLSQ